MAPIYLVRPGRTALSREGRLQGREDHGLSPEGRADAENAAGRLGGRDIAIVYTSPLLRARETAAVIASTLGTHAVPLLGLTDVDVGRWAGRTVTEIAASEPEVFDAYFRFPIAATFPDGERMVEAERRVFDALGTIADLHRGRSVVGVTHELLIRLVLVRLRCLDGTAIWDPNVLPGSVTELRATDGGLELPTVLEDLFRAAARKRSGDVTG
jgi:broad specificity phosphatase PhoE